MFCDLPAAIRAGIPIALEARGILDAGDGQRRVADVGIVSVEVIDAPTTTLPSATDARRHDAVLLGAAQVRHLHRRCRHSEPDRLVERIGDVEHAGAVERDRLRTLELRRAADAVRAAAGARWPRRAW